MIAKEQTYDQGGIVLDFVFVFVIEIIGNGGVDNPET